MNRLQMSDEIANRVPMLIDLYSKEWQEMERLRASFVQDYPVQNIRRLELDQYVIGRGASNRSFCYRVEQELDKLGRILGGTAFKFGVYFGRTKTDPIEEYRFGKKWGPTRDQAFAAVKEAIASLLDPANQTPAAIEKNALSALFKGKILFLYNPDRFAPVYSRDHLRHFAAEMDLSGPLQYTSEMQRSLMEYRANWPELRAQPVGLYVRLLYDLFGYPPGSGGLTSDAPEPSLVDEAVTGARMLGKMPVPPPGAASMSTGHGKPDFEMQELRSKRIGERGEAIVFEIERRRLDRLGRPDLAGRVCHISQKDDGAGYDVLSFEDDGAERPIEVKSTNAPDLRFGFYLTANELERARSLANYHIYFVFSAMGKTPQILPVKNPAIGGDDFTARTVKFHVSVTR